MERLYGKDFYTHPRTPIFSDICLHHGEMQAHDHDFMEIVIVFGGSAQHCTIHGQRRIHAGDVIILRPGTWHSYIKCRNLNIINICFGTEMFQRELHWIIEEPDLSRLFWNGLLSRKQHGVLTFSIPKKATSFCLSQIQSLELMPKEQLAPRQAMHTGVLLNVLSMISLYAPKVEDTSPLAAHPSVLQGIRLLEGDDAKSWNLHSLCEMLCINKFYFVRLFKGVTGLSPMAYLSRIRSEHAATLLLNSDKNIAEIGSLVGWDDPNYFARCFRKHFALSATEYRERFKNKPFA